MIIFDYAKTQGVVTETDASSWNGWTKCKQVYSEQIKPDK